MKAFRVWLGLVLLWTFLLGSYRQLPSFISLMYALAALLAMVFLPPVARVAPRWLALLMTAALLLTKSVLAYPLFGSDLPQTILDVATVLITMVLAAKAARGIQQFCDALVKAAFPGLKPRPFRSAQSQLFREIQRARHTAQPLALLTISAQTENVELLRNRFAEEGLRSIANKYTLGVLAEFLRNEVRSCETVAVRDGCLVAILPSATHEETVRIAEQLQSNARSALGLEVQVGKALFPDQEVTLFGLMKRAETDRKLHIRKIRKAGPWTSPARTAGGMAHHIISRLPLHRAATATAVADSDPGGVIDNNDSRERK